MSQSALSKLLCGDIIADGDGIHEVLSHLSTSIDNVVGELMQLESGACDFLQRKFASLDFLLVLLALIGLSDFYFQKVTRTR
jgi:hypothetical protein